MFVKLSFARLFLPGLLLSMLFSIDASGQKKTHEDDYLYNRMVVISGKVTVSIPGEIGETAAATHYFLLQRVDCKDSVIGVHTDLEGQYRVIVYQGKYRIIARDGTREGEMVDILGPEQPRIVNATNVVGGQIFNIRLVLPNHD